MKELAEQIMLLMPEGEGVSIMRGMGKAQASAQWATNVQTYDEPTKSTVALSKFPTVVQALHHAYKAYGATFKQDDLLLPDEFMQTDSKIDWERVDSFLSTLSSKELHQFVTLWGKPFVAFTKRLKKDKNEMDYACDALESLVEEHGVALA